MAGTAALTGAFLPFRGSITPLSEALAFIVVVVVTAWIGGLGPGILASLLGFVALNFFFLPPYHTFVIASLEHIVLLFVLLGISVLMATLLARTRERAEAAEAREEELRAMQELSRELVVRIPGKTAYEAVLGRLISLLGFTAAALLLTDEESGGLEETATVGTDANRLDPRSGALGDGTLVERLPLLVGRRNLGLLLLRGIRPPLGSGESRVLRAFCDQLAIVVERDRLLRAAARADSYRASEKLRQALLAAVSHDLRSPLAAIKASVTDLLDHGAPPDSAYRQDVLESVDKEVDRLNALIANLLDMSRIEAGMLRARLQTVDVAETVGQCVERARRRWPGLHFRSAVDERAALARADPVFVERVITNLLDNAARATIDSGREDVEVRGARRDDRSTVVRVIDHGKGVPVTVREYLFHPFYDLDERSPRLGPGLGLAICKGFMTSMGGEVWVEETPGGGATFAFSLPAEAA